MFITYRVMLKKKYSSVLITLMIHKSVFTHTKSTPMNELKVKGHYKPWRTNYEKEMSALKAIKSCVVSNV